jgi:voltage-gated potassium channel
MRPGDVALRPIRGFPEYLARAVLAPGTERLIEELLTAEGDECIAVTFTPPVTCAWRDVVIRVLDAGGGTVLGYSRNGDVCASPASTDTVCFDTLFVAVPGHAERSAIAAVRAALA